MKLFQSREEKFYAELIGKHNSRLLAYASSRVRDRFQAEDIVQDVWLTAWSKVNDVMNSANPGGWLMNALKNHLKKHYANIAKAQKIADALIIDGEAAGFDTKFYEEISFASILSLDELRIIGLKEQGFKHREIAEKLGTSKGTIDSKVSRITLKITRFLESE
jgi:RNA polymerase sigma factor (sigma-70 family)